jgi:acetone carboxylase gamma subunit
MPVLITQFDDLLYLSVGHSIGILKDNLMYNILDCHCGDSFMEAEQN